MIRVISCQKMANRSITVRCLRSLVSKGDVFICACVRVCFFLFVSLFLRDANCEEIGSRNAANRPSKADTFIRWFLVDLMYAFGRKKME